MRVRSFAAVAAMGLALASCGGGGQSPAAAQKEISANWTSFFNGTNPDVNGRTKLLQDGPALQPAVAAAASNPVYKAISAKVDTVALQ